MKRDDVILVRGGGDLATGTIHRLWSAGLKVLVLEAEHPAAIRRQVSVSEAVYEGGVVVEGMRAALVKTLDEAVVVWHRGDVPVMVDPKGELIPQVRPAALVDAILAKKNMGTRRTDAPYVIGLGPGFTAGKDVQFSCALCNASSALSGILCVISLKIVPSISKNNADIISSMICTASFLIFLICHRLFYKCPAQKTDIVYYK